jgi:hypothetical protein
MSLRVVSVLAAGLVALTACTSTVNYAVLAPHAAAADNSSCFRQCQLLHAGRTNNYLACLKKCPEARVVNEKECREVPFDATTHTCATEHNQRFDPGPGILAIVVAVVLVALIGASGA